MADRAEWRAWLKKNHNASEGVWLIYYKKHTGKPSVAYAAAVEEALCFGWIDSTVRRLDDDRYMQKYTPRRRRSVWSKLNKQRAARMIKQGLMTDAGLARIEEAKRNGEWNRETSRQEPPAAPPEFMKALARNKRARRNFENMAPSYRRQFIGWFASAKREATKRKRLKEVLSLLERNEKLGMR
jgi:uncharacterized protein YdeI (YjbR/CyaY-like superfamily)